MQEIIIILVIVLIIFGPGKLPEIGTAIGKSIKDFKKAGEEPEEKDDNSIDSHKGEDKQKE